MEFASGMPSSPQICLLRRSFLTAGLILPLTAQSALSANKKSRKRVLAFYYGWYGLKGVSGEDAHWSNPDTVARTIADGPDYPAAGVYDSLSPRTVARQIAEAHAAGITGLIASWWGQSDRTDRQFKLLADSSAKLGMKVSPYIEKADSVDALVGDLDYLYRRYAKHRAFLRQEGRPVIFVFDRVLQTLGVAGWRAARQKLEGRIGRKFFFVGPANSSEEIRERGAAFDALHIYALQFTLGDATAFDGLSPKTYYSTWVGQQDDMAVTTATIMPGFDDTRLPDRENPQTVLRNDGTLFDILWQAAINAAPDWILIVSYNEWHEGSQIEASDRHGQRELDTCRRMSAAFLKDQPLEDDGAVDSELKVSGNHAWMWWTAGGVATLVAGLWLRRARRAGTPAAAELEPITPDDAGKS